MDSALSQSFEGRLRLCMDGLFEAVRAAFHPMAEYWWGDVAALVPLPAMGWEIARRRKEEKGFCHFELLAMRWKGILKVAWERYPNGQYVVQVVDDEDGFEIWNRCPSIIPPEIEIMPGTYVWCCDNTRGNVLAFTGNRLTIACVCQDGLITWERRCRYQMVGRRMHLTQIEERELEETPEGRAFSTWRKVPDKECAIKKHSETEIELNLYAGYRRFKLAPLVRGAKGYFLHESQVESGRVVPPRLWQADSEAGFGALT